MKDADFVYAFELGTQTTMVALELAAYLNVPFLDGDIVGRSVPELQLTTLSLNNITVAPLSITTYKNDAVMISETSSDKRCEDIGRTISGISGGVVSAVGFSLTGKVAKNALISGTISQSIDIGKLIAKGGSNIPADIANATAGIVAFNGIVTDFKVENRNTFFYGTVELKGIGAFEGDIYKVWFQNEFMVSWRNNTVDITCPDLICIVNSDTGIGKVSYGQGFRNEIEVGELLTVIGIPAADVWKTKDALKLFSPLVFGFKDITYMDLKIKL